MIYTLTSDLQRRVLDLTYKHKLSHLSSTIPAANILDHIYSIKSPSDKIVVSNGHCGLALYAVLEKYLKVDAEYLLLKNGIHPNRDLSDGIFCSTGSLGLGILVAVGMALKSKDTIYCTISDGEATEGSVWEALRFIKDNNLQNIKIFAQVNGFGAYSKVSDYVVNLLSDHPNVTVCFTDTTFGSKDDPLKYHYKILDDKELATFIGLINENRIQTTATKQNAH